MVFLLNKGTGGECDMTKCLFYQCTISNGLWVTTGMKPAVVNAVAPILLQHGCREVTFVKFCASSHPEIIFGTHISLDSTERGPSGGKYLIAAHFTIQISFLKIVIIKVKKLCRNREC